MPIGFPAGRSEFEKIIPVQLSVITATHCRPAMLAHVLQQYRMQSISGVRSEHLVISDGPDPTARFLCQRWGATYFQTDRCRGHAGAFAKDLGIAQARGEYVCFWDDDNLYEPHALSTLFAAACGVQIGVVRATHRLRKTDGMVTIPRKWEGRFRAGDIDTMCVCVERQLALRESWGDNCNAAGTDSRWLQKLERHLPAVRYIPIVIGTHL